MNTGSWAVKGNALERTSWISPDVLPDWIYYSKKITRGDCEIKANVWTDQGGEIGLGVLTSDTENAENGYEFRINRNGSPHTVEIVKWVDGAETQVASASAASITANQWVRLRGRLTSLGYDNCGVRSGFRSQDFVECDSGPPQRRRGFAVPIEGGCNRFEKQSCGQR